MCALEKVGAWLQTWLASPEAPTIVLASDSHSQPAIIADFPIVFDFRKPRWPQRIATRAHGQHGAAPRMQHSTL